MRSLAMMLVVAAASAGLAADDAGTATNAAAVVHIARYAGDKMAAASFTFDDGHKSHAGIARTLDTYGIKATFFVVTKWVPDTPAHGDKAKLSWPELRALAESGHEIGNHSLTHMNLQNVTNEETLAAEIDSSWDMIEKGTGKGPVSFAYPFCKSNPTVRERVMRHHVAARGYYPLYEGSCPPDKARPWIDKALTDGGWHIYLSHGIETNALKAHLDDIAPLRDRLWIAPYGEVAAYCAARDRVQLTTGILEKTYCTFTLAMPSDAPTLSAQVPLTVVIPATGVTGATKVTCNPAERVVSVVPRTDSVCVTLRPGAGQVTARWGDL